MLPGYHLHKVNKKAGEMTMAYSLAVTIPGIEKNRNDFLFTL